MPEERKYDLVTSSCHFMKRGSFVVISIVIRRSSDSVYGIIAYFTNLISNSILPLCSLPKSGSPNLKFPGRPSAQLWIGLDFTHVLWM